MLHFFFEGFHKKHSKVRKEDHTQAIKLPGECQPEPGQGNLQIYPDLGARGRGAAHVEQVGGLRTSPRVPESIRGIEVSLTQMIR